MGNLCSIFHAKFDEIKKLTSNNNIAIFLEKCIYWWQISTYTINGSKHIWFTRETAEMALAMDVSVRTIGRYLKELSEEGLIEKTCKLSASNKNNQFKASKKLYIRITDKLLFILKSAQTTGDKTDESDENITLSKQNVLFKKDKMSFSIYKDNNYKHLNNFEVSQNIVNFVDKKNSSSNKHSFPCEKIIGERITEELKSQVKGMLFNVCKEKNWDFKAQDQVYAELLFSLTNKVQLNGIDNMKDRINIAAFLLRNNRWKTPKGFSKHWDVGIHYKEKKELSRNKINEDKLNRELLGVTDPKKIAEITMRLQEAFNEEQRYQQIENSTKKQRTANEIKLMKELQTIKEEIYSQNNYLKGIQARMGTSKEYPADEYLIEVSQKTLQKLYAKKKEIQQILEPYKTITECA